MEFDPFQSFPVSSPIDNNLFTHVRMIFAMVITASLARLLSGVAGMVQQDNLKLGDPIHYTWIIYTFFSIIQFWWQEFFLFDISWRFTTFTFVVCYGSTLYFMCAILFPDKIKDYGDFGQYFMARRGWFFGSLIMFFVLDIIDAFIKGSDHVAFVGIEYFISSVIKIIICFFAIYTNNRHFHLAFAIITLIYELSWVIRHYNVLL